MKLVLVEVNNCGECPYFGGKGYDPRCNNHAVNRHEWCRWAEGTDHRFVYAYDRGIFADCPLPDVRADPDGSRLEG